MGNSKQELKANSVLEIFVRNFPCCRKICEALNVYGLKHYGVMTIDWQKPLKQAMRNYLLW